MRKRVSTYIAVAILACLAPVAGFALTPYSQDFEGLDIADPDALANDGWLIFANVFDGGGGYLYGYGVFPAPNGGNGFCAIVTGQGGPDQGDQQLSVYNDYNNEDHGNGYYIEANVFQEQTVASEDVGTTWNFDFQAKRGNIEGETTALAFIKTLDPNNNFELTNFITEDMTNIPDTWQEFQLSLEIDETLVGQIFQIGFASTATNYEGSGIYYDNINLDFEMPTRTESMTWGRVKALYHD